MSQMSVKIAGLMFVMLVVATAARTTETNGTENDVDDKGERWRILVTNDDGIKSPGLMELVKALSENHDVVVCAPDANRSGASQSVPHLNKPMTVKEVKVVGASQAVAVSGSPADAVCYAVVVLGKDRPFDLVVSGINSSANVGDQSHSSGTVGAAMEGVYRGIPSIAVSQGGRSRDYSFSTGFAARFREDVAIQWAKIRCGLFD